MNERDILIELKCNFVENFDCKDCIPDNKKCKKCLTEKEADYLLENGVIVPPCKVGDTVYCLINRDNELDCCSKHICMSDVENFSFEKRGNEQLLLVHLDFWNTDINPRTAVEFVDVVFGKTVFLTREEAEHELKRIQEGERQ